MTNPFDVLEISPGASPEEIKAAYHRLAKRWHPDRFLGAEKTEAENRFRNLAEAFNALKDRERRAEWEKASLIPADPVSAEAQDASEPKPLAERTAADWLLEAKGAFASDDLSRALGLVQCSLRGDPECAEAHALFAKILDAGDGDTRARVKALENAVRLDPKDADSALRLAELYQSLGMQARAVRVRESARRNIPDHNAFQNRAAKAPSPVPAGEGLMDQLRALTGRLFKRG